jgi:uncharacterized protein YllA (UPF0747 family)
LRFEELPGIPKIWIDFLNSALSALPAPSAMHTLAGRAELERKRAMKRDALARIFMSGQDQRSVKASENILRLRQPDSVVVTTNIYPSLFGGPAVQILKCLTAIKVCDELSKHAITAVPIGWISTAPHSSFSVFSIYLLDNESELQRLQYPESDAMGFSPADPLSAGQISPLLRQIEEIGQGSFDPEMVEILKATFQSGVTIAQATGHLLAALMEEWGMILVDPSTPEFQSILPLTAYDEPSLEDVHQTYVIQSSILPVISCVIDPDEVFSFVGAQPFFDRVDLVQPLAWPQASATLVDIRSRRTLERYNLELNRIYSGEQTILNDLQNAMAGTASKKLESLRAETEAQIAGLKELNSSGKEFAKTLDSGREKILFQIDKLAENFESARNRKLETANRQIHKACNFLAPGRKLQERQLAAIQMPLRYSRSVLRSLYEKLDILSSEHQIIFLD